MSINSRRERRRSRDRRRVRWGRTIGFLALALVGVVAVVAVLGWVLFERVMVAKDSLETAVPSARELPALVIEGSTEEALATVSNVHTAATTAVEQSDFWVWKLAERVPVLGENLVAARVMSESVVELTATAQTVIHNVDLHAFQPVDGVIDLTRVSAAGDAIRAIDAVADDVANEVNRIHAGSLVEELRGPLAQFKDAVSEVRSLTEPLSEVAAVLPGLLGAEGPRTYVLMFQGNSELRASGGNPAALALVRADAGRVDLISQVDSYSFENNRPTSVIPLAPELEAVYGDSIGRWVPDMTYMPDFPTTVEILRGWWATVDLPAFDGVISIDPVALSYLTDATGPIALPTGETLVRDNTVALLLHDVYLNYRSERTSLDEQSGSSDVTADQFFAIAAATVFTKLMSGVQSPMALMAGLHQAADEGRIKFWSAIPAEQELVAGTKLSGVLPTGNEPVTTAGVFFNDTTGSKMDYFIRSEIEAVADRCMAVGPPRFDLTVRLINDAVRDVAMQLPRYITGPNYTPGDVATDVLLYAPPGATITSWDVSGAAEVTLKAEGYHLGRHVLRIGVVTTPQSTATITSSISAAEGVGSENFGPLAVETTPMVTTTPVSITDADCGD